MGNFAPAAIFGAACAWQMLGLHEVGLAATADPTLVLSALQKGLTTVFLGLITILCLIRHPRQGRTATKSGAAVALAGTSLPVLLTLAPPQPPDPVFLTVGAALLITGTAWTILALAALGRSFGVLPEARGLATNGPYRLIRHPVYLGEIVVLAGVAVTTPSPFALGLFATFVALQYWRAINEELVLARAFPDYDGYARTTWRILPGLH